MDDDTSSPAITSNGASVLQSQPAMTSNAQVLDGQAQIAHQSKGMQSISSDEIALYDRQIRLWGVQAQERLRNANILLITMRALANEIAKNLVLAGIGSLTIQDDQLVTDDDSGAQFFISEDDIGKNRAEAAAPQIRKLNPRVGVHVVTENIADRSVDFYVPFDMVIATDLDLSTLSRINAASRLSGKPFYAAGTHGFYGFVFADLGQQHHFMIEREKSNRPTIIGPETLTRNIMTTNMQNRDGKEIEIVSKREIYSPLPLANTSPLPEDLLNNRRRKFQVTPLLSCLRALWEFQKLSNNLPSASQADLQLFTTLASQKHAELQLPKETLRIDFLKSFLHNLGSEIPPVTAFLGGHLAQDAINVLGQREQPIQNFLLFDGEESKGQIYALHPIFPDMPLAVPDGVAAAPVAASMVM